MPISAAGGRGTASTTAGIPVAAVVAILIAGSAQVQPALGAEPSSLRSGKLTFSSVPPQTTELTGPRQLSPEVTITSPPLPHDFGAYEVGTISYQQQFVIEYTGAGPLSIPAGGIHVSTEAGCADFALFESTPHVDVPPAGTVSFDVQFAPSGAGIVGCTIEIESNDPTSPTTLMVGGEGLAPILEVTPDVIEFPVTLVEGVSASEEITIRNVGQLDMSVNDIVLDDTTHFELTSAPALPVTIGPFMAEIVGVRFTPVSPGPHTAVVTITTSNPVPPTTVFVDLSGEAVQPELYITPSVLHFEPAVVDETSTDELTFDNPGGAELEVASIALVGPQAGQFAIVGPTSFTVPAGGTRPLSVECTPTAIGEKDATLVVMSDAANMTSDPTLQCRGVGPDECTPTCAIFGDGFESGDVSAWSQ